MPDDTESPENNGPAGRAAWVLVGGRSSRMGTDKALLDAGRGPLAAEIAALAAQSCPVVSLVGDPVRYSGLGLPVVGDNFPGLGPLSGIEAALRASKSEWNLIVACDMPFLERSIFELLFTEAAGFDCAVPQHPDGRVEPLCAVYRRRCQPTLEAALDKGIRKVTDALQALAVRYVVMASEVAFANWNTPQDIRNRPHG